MLCISIVIGKSFGEILVENRVALGGYMHGLGRRMKDVFLLKVDTL